MITMDLFRCSLSNVKNIFSGKNLIWHAVVIVVTYLSVVSGFDWWVKTAAGDAGLRGLALGAGLLGFVLPVAVPLSMLIIGGLRRNSTLVKNGWILGRTELIAMLLSFFYKALTGRPGPYGFDVTDISGVFRFGFLRGGVFHGWPSSHIIVAVAGAVTLMVLYRHKRFIKYLALAYGIYMTLAVSVTFHWFSDGVAAVILGTVVGLVVAKSPLMYTEST